MVINYKIIKANTTENLSKLVNDALNIGYELRGFVTICPNSQYTSTEFYQCVIKRDKA